MSAEKPYKCCSKHCKTYHGGHFVECTPCADGMETFYACCEHCASDEHTYGHESKCPFPKPCVGKQYASMAQMQAVNDDLP